MAGAGSFPKYMAVAPVIIGVTDFIRDTGAVRSAVLGMSKDINKAVRQINKTTTAKINTSINKLGTSATKTTTALSRTNATLAKTSVVTSRATARVQALNATMGRGITGLNRWRSGFDATNNPITRFGSTLGMVSRGMTRFSFQLDRLGRSMLMGVTLPIIAGAVAMLKFGADFEAAIVKVETLVGVSGNTVKAWGDEILDVAAKLGSTPVEMAQGLFAAASGFGSLAGQAPVMDVLIASTKAAAIGLGEIEDIARAATSMMNAFGRENLSAEQAVSLLVLGVREGNLEVDALATAVGNVLGTATAIGAGADDVIAFIAAYTRFGVEPTRAVTSLNTALTNLIKPSKQAREILERYGLTLDKIKERMAGPGGLADLFVSMSQQMPEEDFFALFGIRSLRAILAVTAEAGLFMEEYIRIARSMQDEAEGMGEALEESFGRVADTLRFKFEVIKGQLQTIFIGANAAIAPFLKEYADRIILLLDDINRFVRANEETVKVIIKVALAAALIAPALLLFSKFLLTFGLLLTVVGGFVKIVGVGIGIIINFGVALGVLIANIVVRSIMAFLTLGLAIFNATVALSGFIAKWVAFAVMNIFSAAGTMATGFITLLAAIGPVALALGAIVAIVSVVVTAIAGLGSVLVEAGSTVTTFFKDTKDKAVGWGKGLVHAFSQGIFEGLVYLIEALNAIGRTITKWLRGASPPRIAPDIDKWGTATMQEWIDGWGKADFGIFTTIQGVVKSFLTSLKSTSGKDDDGKGIAKVLLNVKQFIAGAINEMKKFGKVSAEAMQSIFNAIGTTTLELENYINAVIRAGAASGRLADAQKEVNDITEKYSALLDPIQRQMDAITDQKNLEYETKRLEKIMGGGAPEYVKELAGLQLQKIQLESERDKELDVANIALNEAQILNDIAQEDLELTKLALGLQTASFDLLAEINKEVKELKGTIESASEKIGDAIGEATELESYGFDPPDVDPWGLGDDDDGEGGVLGEIDAKLLELQERLETTKAVWIVTWTTMLRKYNLWKKNITTSYGLLETWFWDKFGLALTTFQTEWDLTWPLIAETFGAFWLEIEPEVMMLLGWFKSIGDEGLDRTPNAIKAVGAAIREHIIPALGGILTAGANTIFSAEWWDDKLGKDEEAPDPADDPINKWFWARGDAVANAFGGLSDIGGELGAGELGAGPLHPQHQRDWEYIPFLKRMRKLLSTETISALIMGWANEIDFSAIFDGLFKDPLAGPKGTTPEGYYRTPQKQRVPSPIKEIVTDPIENFLRDSSSWVTGLDYSGFFSGLYDSVHDFFVPEGQPTFAEMFLGIKQEDVDTAQQAVKDFFKGLTSNDLGPSNSGIHSMGLGIGIVGVNSGIAQIAVGLLKGKIEEFGLKLTEIKDNALTLWNTKVDTIKEKIDEWKEKIDTIKEDIGLLAADINDIFIIALNDLYDLLFEDLNPAFDALWTWLDDLWTVITEEVVTAIGDLGEAFDKLKTDTLDGITSALQTIVGLLSEAWNYIMNLPNNLPDWVPFVSGGGGGSSDNDSDNEDEDENKVTSNKFVAPKPPASVQFPVKAPLSVLSPTAPAEGVAVVALSFGDVNINNDMDVALFEAKVRKAVAESMLA